MTYIIPPAHGALRHLRETVPVPESVTESSPLWQKWALCFIVPCIAWDKMAFCPFSYQFILLNPFRIEFMEGFDRKISFGFGCILASNSNSMITLVGSFSRPVVSLRNESCWAYCSLSFSTGCLIHGSAVEVTSSWNPIAGTFVMFGLYNMIYSHFFVPRFIVVVV